MAGQFHRSGYQKREYWKHRIVKDGRVPPWETAMAELRTCATPGAPALPHSGTLSGESLVALFFQLCSGVGSFGFGGKRADHHALVIIARKNVRPVALLFKVVGHGSAALRTGEGANLKKKPLRPPLTPARLSA